MTKRYVTDLLKALKLSAAVSVGGLILLWTGGFMFSGFTVRIGFMTARSGLLILGALLLLVFAAANLFRQGKLLELNNYQAEWEKRFSVFQVKTVLFIVSVVVLIVASIIDYFLYYRMG